MSLLEKAAGGKKSVTTDPLGARTSLFARALASAREESINSVPPGLADVQAASPTIASYPVEDLMAAQEAIAALPSSADSMLELWELCSSRLPLAALALFLPRGDDFMALAGRSGFPAGSSDPIPVSIAPSTSKSGEVLPSEARAILAPLLGVPIGMSLRGASLWSDSCLLGLWVYHDPELEASSKEAQDKLASILSCPGPNIRGFALEGASADPSRTILAAAKRFPSASLLAFDLAPLLAEDKHSKGLEREVIRSSFLAACRQILAPSGSAFAFGETSVACVIGSSSDVDLVLFQFSKTLKRALPRLYEASSPSSRAQLFDPSRPDAAEELSRFVS
jgi:hypothetical protein